MTAIRFGSVSCAVLLAAGSAQAQTARRVDIGASGEIIYDDNATRSNGERARLRGLSKDDFIFRPGATIDVLLPFGRQALAVGGTVGYDFYANNSRLNRERIALDANAALQFAQCNGSIYGSFARQQSDLADLTFGPGALDITNTSTVSSLGASASCGRQIGFRPTASITFTRGRNSDERRQFSNNNSTSISGGVTYARPVLGTFTLFGSYTRSTFPDRGRLFGFPDDGFESKAVSGRFERQIGSRMTGSIEAGYSNVTSKRAGVPAFSGLTGAISLNVRATDRIQASISASRAASASNTFAANYSINTSVGLEASYAVSDRLVLSAGGVYASRDLRGEVPVFGPTIGGDETVSIHADAGYRLNDRIRLGLALNRVDRSAENRIYDFASNRVSLSARLGF